MTACGHEMVGLGAQLDHRGQPGVGVRHELDRMAPAATRWAPGSTPHTNSGPDIPPDRSLLR